MSPDERIITARAGWSAGWYWQTDLRHRLVHLFGTPAGHASIGRPPWEQAGADTQHPDWTLQFDAFMARRSFENVPWRRVDASGRVHHYLLSGEPMYGPKGRFRGFRGVGHETGDALMAMRELVRGIDDLVATLVAHVAQVRAQADDVPALRGVLDQVDQVGRRVHDMCVRVEERAPLRADTSDPVVGQIG